MCAFLAHCGIAINKGPGVCPIIVGKCRKRIEAKAMVLATLIDVLEICSADQLCEDTKAGIEAAVHAMKELFKANKTEGLLLVDTANAFNSSNRPAALWKCHILWPCCSSFLFNCYHSYATIILKGLSGSGQDYEADLMML